MNRVWMIGLVLASLSACGSSDQDKLIGKNVSVNAAGLDLNQIDLTNESGGNSIAADRAAPSQLENGQSANAASVAPQPSTASHSTEKHSSTLGSRAKPQSESSAAANGEQANSVEQNDDAPHDADQNETEPGPARSDA